MRNCGLGGRGRGLGASGLGIRHLGLGGTKYYSAHTTKHLPLPLKQHSPHKRPYNDGTCWMFWYCAGNHKEKPDLVMQFTGFSVYLDASS